MPTARGRARLPRARAVRSSWWCSSRTCSASIEQANLPGTVDEHPNWRRKLPVALERCGAKPRVQQALRGDRAHARPLAARTRRRGMRGRRCASRARPTGCSCTARFTLRRRGAHRAVPRAARREPRLLLADPRARGPAARTATTSSTTTRSTPSSAARAGFERFVAGAASAHGMGQVHRHGAQPHGRARHGQRLVAGRARERAGLARMPATSTSTGNRPAPTSPTRCCCRCSATTTGRCWSAASCSCAGTPAAGALRRALLRPPLSARAARRYSRILDRRRGAVRKTPRQAHRLRAIAESSARPARRAAATMPTRVAAPCEATRNCSGTGSSHSATESPARRAGSAMPPYAR